jgi:diguanylate cyclase (GGDEF)-like protein
MHSILNNQLQLAKKKSETDELNLEILISIIDKFYHDNEVENLQFQKDSEKSAAELNRTLLLQLELILETIHDGVILLDENFNFNYANTAFRNILQALPHLQKDRDANLWKVILDTLKLQKNTFQAKNIFEIKSDGRSYFFELNIHDTPNFENSSHLGILRNITEQKESLKALDRTNDLLIEKIVIKESALEALANSLEIEASQRKVAQASLEYLAYHDVLTGLMNRVSMKKYFEEELLVNHRDNLIVFLFSDLDKFKIVNDTLGHFIGDELLKLVAKRLENCIGNLGKVSRQGGDEFIIIINTFDTKKQIVEKCEEIIQIISKEYSIFDHKLNIDLCIGISIFPENGNDFDSLVQTADTAMYKAKELGSGVSQFYSTDMGLELFEQLTLGNWLKLSVDRNELLLLFQPKLNLKMNRIESAEALIRWNHPIRGLIPPIQFIPIAEQSGIIFKIGDWVLETTCREVDLWTKRGYNLNAAVNLSSVQFNKENIHKDIQRIVLKHSINPKNIELEITESGMMKDMQSAIRTLHLLKDAGFTITIDDFGTGYSSLSYLKELPIHNLKIDKSFINGIPTNKKDCAIVKAIIDLAKSLDLYIIAEGIETEEQKDFLIRNGCDAIQGYLFSRPIPVSDFFNSKIIEPLILK